MSDALVVYVNGDYVRKNQAKISVFDFGFLRGVFAVPSVWILKPEQIEAGGRAMITSVRAMPAESLDPKIKSDVTLMLDRDGHVTEGPGCNVFVVKHGTLFSPPDGILMGITRQTVPRTKCS